MPCFVIFWLLLRPSFFSRPRSFPMMPMPAAEVAVVAIVEVEGACAPEVFMAAPFTPDGSMAEAGATMQEVRGQAIRSPVVLAVQVTPLRAVPVVRSPVIRDMAIEARLTVPPPSVRRAGAYGYYNNNYNNGCYQDTYGNWVCPNQYPY